jgi:hypothetical protein
LTGDQGINNLGKRPHLTGDQGINNLGNRPDVLGDKGMIDSRVYRWMRDLAERLRYVKVVCGDWTRVCGGNWQADNAPCGIFFDPPYSAESGRSNGLYECDSTTVAHDVSKWCVERGKNSDYRIVLAGYYNEHEWMLNEGWTVMRWSAQGGYANTEGVRGVIGQQNRHKEALFISPHCVGLRTLL